MFFDALEDILRRQAVFYGIVLSFFFRQKPHNFYAVDAAGELNCRANCADARTLINRVRTGLGFACVPIIYDLTAAERTQRIFVRNFRLCQKSVKFFQFRTIAIIRASSKY